MGAGRWQGAGEGQWDLLHGTRLEREEPTEPPLSAHRPACRGQQEGLGLRVENTSQAKSPEARGPGPQKGPFSHAGWPTCMDAHVVLVVGGAGEAAATVRLRAGVGPLACVGAHVYFTDVRCGEGAAAALEGAPEWAFTCEHGVRGVGWLR